MSRAGWPLKAADGRPFYVVKREREERLIALIALIIIARGGLPCE